MSNRHVHQIFRPLLDFVSGNKSTNLPAWATQEVYEYDLGMMTSCYQCDKALQEGQIHWVDRTCKGLKERYCSQECVLKADLPIDILELDPLFESIPDLQKCDDCSEPSADLIEVNDSDPSVGYYSSLALCPTCLKRRSQP